MATTYTFATIADRYPVGMLVGAYASSQVPPGSSQAPQGGAPVATATVASNGSLVFTGLLEGTKYAAGALVGSRWLYTPFITAPHVPATNDELAALISANSAAVAALGTSLNGLTNQAALLLADVPFNVAGGKTVATYLPTPALTALGSLAALPAPLVRLPPLAAAGATQRLFLDLAVAANDTALGSAVATFGLYPVSAASGASAAALALTLGTKLAGSDVVLDNSLGVDQPQSVLSSAIVPPVSTGIYALACVISGATVPANVLISGRARVWYRNVYTG